MLEPPDTLQEPTHQFGSYVFPRLIKRYFDYLHYLGIV